MLLTIFEQDHFTDDRAITKNYVFPIKNDMIKNILNLLHDSGTDPKEKEEIEKEQEAQRVYDVGMRGLKDSLIEKDKIIMDKEKALLEKDRLIEELKRKLGI